MNLIMRLSIASTMLASSAIYAAEPDDGWYAGFMIGGSYLNNIDVNISTLPLLTITTTTLPSNLTTEFTYKVGFNGGFQAGYRWCENYRFEGQLYINYNKLEKVQFPIIGPIRSHQNPLGLSVSGNTGMLAGFFNAYYDFYTPGSATNVVPYAGIGIGYSYLRTKFNLYQFGNVITGTDFQESTTAPVGQGILGISYFFDDTISFGADFRYLTTNKISDLNGGRVALGSLNLFMNFGFDQPTPS
ncbi:opacity protein-like surface antigen [Legionella beliardensis]|uniref:Opacity protein-like surface antigen n=1 Tax=Legionella beliardensis TaxID=91822 RepID=A0A378I1W1_9GAMM|nr:outer membrane beta-barrel protein [Legionella beliardensis]STX28665.1 opacity protein-like surface antigen [Legionella beliardensis]